jgi:hypothetical protein
LYILPVCLYIYIHLFNLTAKRLTRFHDGARRSWQGEARQTNATARGAGRCVWRFGTVFMSGRHCTRRCDIGREVHLRRLIAYIIFLGCLARLRSPSPRPSHMHICTYVSSILFPVFKVPRGLGVIRVHKHVDCGD